MLLAHPTPILPIAGANAAVYMPLEILSSAPMDARLYTALCFGVRSWALSGVVEGTAFEVELRRPSIGWVGAEAWYASQAPYSEEFLRAMERRGWDAIYSLPVFCTRDFRDFGAAPNHAVVAFAPIVSAGLLDGTAEPRPWLSAAELKTYPYVDCFGVFSGDVSVAGARPPEVSGNEYHTHPCTITAFGVQATIYLRVANARQEQVTLNLRVLYYEEFVDVIDAITGVIELD